MATLPLIPLLLALPFPAESLYATDVDGDGVAELVAVGRAGQARRLAVVEIGETPRVRAVELGARAAWWDAAHGVWLADGEGLRRVDEPGWRAALVTPLAGIGPALPERAPLVYDLDDDMRAELLVWASGRLHGYDHDGTPLGSAPLPARGALSAERASGGTALGVSLQSPIFTVADADGDGLADVLSIDGDALVVHRTGPACELGVETLRWPLPTTLEDPLFQERDAREYTTDVHLRDLDGDRRVDLLVHRVLSDGSLFGTEAEVRVWRGNGAGFGEGQTLPVEGGSASVYPVDLDGDGDLELVTLQVDLDAVGLARGLIDGRVRVKLLSWSAEAGRYGAPVALGEVRVPVLEGGASWNVFADLDGDGRNDLALYRDGEISVWPGTPAGFPEPRWTALTEAPVDELLVADLDGDGASELISWARGADRFSVWRTR